MPRILLRTGNAGTFDPAKVVQKLLALKPLGIALSEKADSPNH
jgi:hypothetical protein